MKNIVLFLLIIFNLTISQTFSKINAGLIGIEDGSVDWGDYDNDGDLDILLTGHSDTGTITKIYRIDPGVFNDINDGIIGDLEDINRSTVAWGDYDNDGDLDLLFFGEINSDKAAFIYRNNSFNLNTKPTPPDNLTSEIIEGSAILSWDKATDAETPQDGLSYNLYLGTENSEGNIYGPMSNISDGYRKIVEIGNVGQKTSRIIKNLEPGIYYWSVHAIDNAYAGSIFALEQTFSYTGIDNDKLPITTALYQNYPNPFNPVTSISYALPQASNVELNVYNLNGQLVQSFVNGRLDKGIHKAEFNAEDMTSGLYIYNLKVDNKVVSSKKMMLLK